MTMDRQVLEEFITLPLTPSMAAGLHRLTPRQGELKGCVLMLHGFGQDSRIFLNSDKGVGLAYSLVDQGYEVFVCSYRGRDASHTLLRQQPYSWLQLVIEDLPLIWKAVDKRHRHPQRFLMGYQLGSVLWSAFLARNPEIINQVAGIVHFNPQRVQSSVGWLKQLNYGFFECKLIPSFAALLGYVPAMFMGDGLVNESRALLTDIQGWQQDSWQDREDGFDYHQAMKTLSFPPSLYFVSAHQKWMQREVDSRNFMFELAKHDARMIKLSAKTGNKRNYSVSELCTNTDAEEDYYPLLLAWLQEIAEKSCVS